MTHAVRTRACAFWAQMPKAGMGLPQAQLDAIGGWICQGAADD